MKLMSVAIEVLYTRIKAHERDIGVAVLIVTLLAWLQVKHMSVAVERLYQ